MNHQYSHIAHKLITAAGCAADWLVSLEPGHLTVDARWVAACHTGLVRHDLIRAIRESVTESCLARLTPEGGVASKYGGVEPAVISTALALEHLPEDKANSAAAWLRSCQRPDGSWQERSGLPWPSTRPWYSSPAGRPWVTGTVAALLRSRSDCLETVASAIAWLQRTMLAAARGRTAALAVGHDNAVARRSYTFLGLDPWSLAQTVIAVENVADSAADAVAVVTDDLHALCGGHQEASHHYIDTVQQCASCLWHVRSLPVELALSTAAVLLAAQSVDGAFAHGQETVETRR